VNEILLYLVGQRPDKNTTKDNDRSVSRWSWSTESHWLGSRTMGNYFVLLLPELIYNELLSAGSEHMH